MNEDGDILRCEDQLLAIDLTTPEAAWLSTG